MATASINWGEVGSNIAGLTTILTNLGVSTSNMPGIFSSIGALSNPNKSDELATCQKILLFASSPQMVQANAMHLANDVGIPADAAALALTLTTPGADIPKIVLEIEQLINQGG